MKVKRTIRAIGGLLTLLTLLGLIAHPEVTLSIEDRMTLLSVIAALLGVDIAQQLHKLPAVTISTDGEADSQLDEGDRDD